MSSPSIEVEPHDVMNPSPTHQTSSHTSIPTKNAQETETSKQHVGHESSSYWTIHAIGICYSYFF